MAVISTNGDWRRIKSLRILARLAVVVPVYVLLYSVCYFVAYMLRFDFVLNLTVVVETFWITLPIVVLIKCGVFLLRREWRRRHRYTTLIDVQYVVMSASISAVIIYAINTIDFGWRPIPRTVILIDWLLSIMAVSLLRTGVGLLVESARTVHRGREQKRTIIFGASSAGVSILRTLQASHSDYEVVGFVDDSLIGSDSMVAGVPVFAASAGLATAVNQLEATHVLIPGSVSGKHIREMLLDCENTGIKAHVIPAVHDIVDGRYKLKIRDVTISDLLRREPAVLDFAGIRGYVSGRRVLVTGAAGSIGSELCRQILALKPACLVLVDQSESGIFFMEQEFKRRADEGVELQYRIADVCDKESMARIIDDHKPQLMFHAAAYKHVPLMESNPEAAVRNNVLGTKNVVDLADKAGVERFVMISTDKAVRPTSIMGETKLLAEKYLQAVASCSETRFITVRFGNVLDSVGSVVPTFRQQIEAGGPVTVTHPDMVRYFMTIPEAVQLVLQSGAVGQSGDVLILDMGKPVKILDLAKDMIYLSGLKYPDDIEIVFTGIRSGEKLFEELFYESEGGDRKVRDKIICARREGVSLSDVREQLAHLQDALDDPGQDAAALLHEIAAKYVREDQPVETQLQRAA